MNLIAQIGGLAAMVALLAVYQQKTRRRLLLCKLAADLSWVIHYLCLSAPGGAIPNFVGIFREIVFMHREEKKWASSPLWPVLFILLNWGLAARTFVSPINLLPIAASTLVTISLWCRKPTLTKLLSVPVCLTFLIYNGLVGSWIGVVNESLSLLSILLGYIRSKSKKEIPRYE